MAKGRSRPRRVSPSGRSVLRDRAGCLRGMAVAGRPPCQRPNGPAGQILRLASRAPILQQHRSGRSIAANDVRRQRLHSPNCARASRSTGTARFSTAQQHRAGGDNPRSPCLTFDKGADPLDQRRAQFAPVPHIENKARVARGKATKPGGSHARTFQKTFNLVTNVHLLFSQVTLSSRTVSGAKIPREILLV